MENFFLFLSQSLFLYTKLPFSYTNSNQIRNGIKKKQLRVAFCPIAHKHNIHIISSRHTYTNLEDDPIFKNNFIHYFKGMSASCWKPLKVPFFFLNSLNQNLLQYLILNEYLGQWKKKRSTYWLNGTPQILRINPIPPSFQQHLYKYNFNLLCLQV